MAEKHHRVRGRAMTQDLMKGHKHMTLNPKLADAEASGNVPSGTGGLVFANWSSHPRYYEQKTAAERKTGRKMDNEEFERDFWREPESEIISGTSIFDPVLCELSYRWFCPPGGLVLDPFAGGSVRGIVASRLGRQYLGAELRPEQIAANRMQAATICRGEDPKPTWIEADSREIDWWGAMGCGAPALDEGMGADFVFSCPPYADLEVYSDDPRDISTMDYPEFRAALRAIVDRACAALKQDRFACFVIGDARDSKGRYYGVPWHTIEAFQAAGLHLYNEAVLVTSAGSLPIRAAKQFEKSRKFGKMHQNYLVFVKGDPVKATEAIGAIEFGELELGADGQDGAEITFGEKL